MFTQSYVIVVAVQLLRAVSHLRQNRVVHRDLKPDNVLVWGQHKRQVSLIDFGTAKDLVDTKLNG